MFKTIPFEPQWQKWFETVEEASDTDTRYTCEDYVAVVELKKVYKINRDLQEIDVETATKEQLERYNNLMIEEKNIDVAEEV